MRSALLQLGVAALCAALALFVAEVGFAFGETPGGTPLEWKLALDFLLGVIVLVGSVLGYVSRGFPWWTLLLVPLILRALMLRPFQHDLYPFALTLGAYTDFLFLLGVAIGSALNRWRRRKTNQTAPQFPDI